MPEISVIMGVYNCKDVKLLKQSIESIINQTYTDWEFIICDDGSTDDTLKRLKEISVIDSRIKVITYSNNKGLAHALNVCIENAKGKYIARQDDDDISLPNRLEEEIKIMDKYPEYSIVGSIADVFDDNGIWGEFNVVEQPEKRDFLWSCPFLHPVTMFRTETLKAVGGYRVAKETRRCEDYDLFMRMYAEGYKGYNIQKKLYLYRIVIGTEKYRPMKYRIDEAIVRWIGYKKMGILIKGIPFVFKPVIIGLIPQKIFKIIRKKQY